VSILGDGGGDGRYLTMNKERTTADIESVTDEQIKEYCLSLYDIILGIQVVYTKVFGEGNAKLLETFCDRPDRFPSIEI
jgi:hypothetical protein